MKVDQYIIRAINQYIAANRTTQKYFARQRGVSEATMVKWRKSGNGISDANWSALYSRIKDYLPKDRLYISSTGDEEYSSLNEGKKNMYYIPVLIPSLKSADLIKYNPVVSVEQFAQSENITRIEYRPKVIGIGGMFSYELETASAGVPPGARLFVSSEAKPRNNSLVLAVTNGKEIVLGIFKTTGRMFELDSGEKKLTGHLDDIRRLFTGFFPVISYEVICF